MCKAEVVGLAILALAATARAAGDITVADFEGKDYGAWKATGDAFGRGPARGTIGRQQNVSGFAGKGLVNTFIRGDRSTGTLTSPTFTIQRQYVTFLIGGGGHVGRTCINLLIGGKVVHTATGRGNELLLPESWNVAVYKGKTAHIQIVDSETGGWGHINIDQIAQSDKPRKANRNAPPPRRPARPNRRPAARVGNRDQAIAALKAHGVKDIVFTTRQVDGDGHWYANFSYWSNNPARKLYHEGGRLCRLNVATGKVTTLIDEPKGGVRDPQMHYDGKKMIFSYRKGGQPFYHLYEINVDGTGLRQLTRDEFDDIEPIYLPDGDIIFCSSRGKRFVQCYFVRVATIHRCKPDGSGIRELSCNIEQDNTPWVLPDGRILYQRREYIDRSQVRFHHLWTMNPDGTNQMVYFGNMHGSIVMIDAKPIPGTHKTIVSFSPGHGRKEHAGVMTTVDPSNGPDDRSMARSVVGGFYRDPYPLSEECFIVARDTDICVINKGVVSQLYDIPAEWKIGPMQLHEPRPLRSRPRERVRPQLVDLTQSTGTVTLENVYIGRNMKGIKPGEIKKLLVLEALPKPINFSGGQEPLTMGGSFTLERILGTVPVEEDGSAHMELPALRSLFFVALDENDLSVKRMQSFMTVQPGERLSCLGCHEQRGTTGLARRRAKAMFRDASEITPIADVPDVFDFPRDIQPILDKHCLPCHGPTKTDLGGPYAGKILLDGGRTPKYSHSYYILTVKRLFSDGRNGDGNRPPRSIGSSASPLMKMLEPAHFKVNMTAHEKKMVRLWIESAATYPGTYAALGSGMVGGVARDGRIQKVIASRCRSCHNGAAFRDDVHFNLSDPARSLVLTMPLDPQSGGNGMVRKVKREGKTVDERVVVFKNPQDPDYQAILDAVARGKAHLDKVKRFDMPDFRPNIHYLREMKVYGVLPKNFDIAKDPANCYELDRKYWKSLWYYPKDRQAPEFRD